MGCSVSMRGEMHILDNTETEALLAGLQDWGCGVALRFPAIGGYLAGSLEFDDRMSYTSQLALEDDLKRLAPYLREPACFKFVVDDEQYEFWVGEEEAVSKARRQRRMQELAEKVRNLSDEEIVELLELADKSHFVNSSR